ncbi:hypothetical protein Cfor_07547 [Coptotermes formosanus]|uniref:Uncharacterized protein n=1 Tax=Coptotermes formosanus TaxID=36987 RepID=A0A6L2PME0_COPFO|nr:hypothetical protein Cfor_07062 [Coptotermes formosanus]GFG37360.1 hypothetical protein Cfor_07547 [Coptotermes formosanus]
MTFLITDVSYERGSDGKYHHHQVPCDCLQEYITCHVPPFFASEVTQRLMRYVSIYYVVLIKDRFKSACQEIAPHVLKAVIHPSVKCLDFIRDNSHPTLLDYYKEIEADLIYRTLPLLKGLKVLRLGTMSRVVYLPVEVEGFRNSLEEFACRDFWLRDLAAVAGKCQNIRRLDIGVPIDSPSSAFYYISKFKYLEELDLSRLYFIPESEMHRILLWLAGTASDEERPEQSEHVVAPSAGTSQHSASTSAAENFRTSSARNPGLLKSFGCLNATDGHIETISQFYNLTSLVMANPKPSASLAPLSNLKLLKNLRLIGCKFSDVQEVLESIGKQLTCLNLVDVSNTDFSFISQNCRSLECLHLCFSFSHELLLPPNYLNPESHSLPLPDFPHVFSLQLCLADEEARLYVLSRFQHLKKLSLVFTDEDLLILESLIERKMLTRLEELYWGCDTVIQLSGSTATKTVFHYSGRATVHHIRT